MAEVWLLDYGAGNVRSVANALRKLGATVHTVATPSDIAAAKVGMLSPSPCALPLPVLSPSLPLPALFRSLCSRILTAHIRARTHAQTLVFPGVGSFGSCMTKLTELQFVEPLKQYIAAGRPLLGVCLGLQLFFEGSEESPGQAGLGVIPGHVRRYARTIVAALRAELLRCFLTRP